MWWVVTKTTLTLSANLVQTLSDISHICTRKGSRHCQKEIYCVHVPHRRAHVYSWWPSHCSEEIPIGGQGAAPFCHPRDKRTHTFCMPIQIAYRLAIACSIAYVLSLYICTHILPAMFPYLPVAYWVIYLINANDQKDPLQSPNLDGAVNSRPNSRVWWQACMQHVLLSVLAPSGRNFPTRCGLESLETKLPWYTMWVCTSTMNKGIMERVS